MPRGLCRHDDHIPPRPRPKQVIRSLGQGAFARCVLARRKADGNLYAIKQFKVPFSDLKAKEQAEVRTPPPRVLSCIDHACIVCSLGVACGVRGGFARVGWVVVAVGTFAPPP